MSIFDTKSSGSIFSKSESGSMFSSDASSFGGNTNELDLDVAENLRFLAEQNGYKESRVTNALDTASRVLNWDIARIAGAAYGIASKDKTVTEGIKYGIEKNIGFSEVIREVVGTPETRLGKVVVGTAGFAADIFLSPLTYLSFGTAAGAKVGGKTLTKSATKLLNQASTEIYSKAATLSKAATGIKAAESAAGTLVTNAIKTGDDAIIKAAKESAKELRQTARFRYKDFIEEGVDPIRAERLAKAEASRDVNELSQRLLAGKFTVENADKFIKAGVNARTIESLAQIGPRLLDEGGIKMFGKTLVSSEALAKTPVGMAAKRLGETEIAQAVKNTLGRTFIYNFGKNAEVTDHLQRMTAAQKRAAYGLTETLDNVFNTLSEPQRVELFSAVEGWKKETLDKAIKITDDAVTDIKTLFPDIKVPDAKVARELLDGLDDEAVAEITAIRKNIDDILKPFFKEVTGGRIGRQKETIASLQAMLKKIRAERGSVPALGKIKSVGEVDLNPEVLQTLKARLFGYEEERLQDIIEKLSSRIEKAKTLPKGTKAAKLPKTTKASALEEVALSEKIIKQIQDDVTKKTELLTKVVTARRAAKAAMRAKKLDFDDKSIQQVSNFLFEGDASFMAKMAKTAGLSEIDTFKYYLPSKFDDIVKVKGFVNSSRISSVKLDSLKLYNGIQGEHMIKDSAKLAKMSAIETVTARIKNDYIKALFNKGGLGKPFTAYADETAAKAAGYELFERKLLDGEFKGWLPKGIVDDIKSVIEPTDNIMNDLGKVTGFDAATGLFKGYVTSLFPAFHFRNMTSNQFQGLIKYGMDWANPQTHREAVEILTGVNPSAVVKTAAGKTYTHKELLKMIKVNANFLDKGAFDNIEMMIDEMRPSARTLGGVMKQHNLNPLSRDFAPIQAGRVIGTGIENYSKVTAVIASIKNGKPIKEAIKEAEDALFNYQALTPFEKDFMRRVLPFYTWTRKNFELQLKTLATTPGRTAAQFKFLRGVNESLGEPMTGDEDEGLPPWLRDNFGIKTNSFNNGQSSMMTGVGHPLEEFFGRFSGEKGFLWNSIANTIVMANPLFKYPLEKVTGVDLFRGKPIAELTDASQLAGMIQAMGPDIGKQFADFVNYREIEVPQYINGIQVGTKTKYYADPNALHLFRNLPTARLAATTQYLTEQTPAKTTEQARLKLATGLQVTKIDKTTQEYFDELAQKEDMIQFLDQLDIIGVKDVIWLKENL
jgi:hypothetical protein